MATGTALVASAAGNIGGAVMRAGRQRMEGPLAHLVGWELGDFIFNTGADVISDVNKIDGYGVTERMNSATWLLRASTA